MSNDTSDPLTDYRTFSEIQAALENADWMDDDKVFRTFLCLLPTNVRNGGPGGIQRAINDIESTILKKGIKKKQHHNKSSTSSRIRSLQKLILMMIL